MTRAVPFSAICVAGILGACSALAAGQSDSSPIQVKGTEHIAWDQTAPRGGWIVGFRFTAYVDGEPQALPDATCSPVFCSQCGCTAPLPRMSSGTHRIEITARDIFGSESGRSAPIFVMLGSAATQSSHAATLVRPQIAPAASSPPTIDVLSTALKNPSAIAVAPDGRIFIAERDGAIVIWKDGSLQWRPAATIDDVAVAADAALVDVTLHPDFSTNARVFVAYSAREPDGAFANRIVRYREVGGILGEAAVVFEDRIREPSLRTPRIRIGPDGKLYALFPGGANGGAAIGSSYAGKILRLNEDGSTPADNPGSAPVLDRNSPLTTAFDWEPETRAMRRSDSASVIAFYADGRNISPTLIEVGLDGGGDIANHWFPNGDVRITDLVVGPDGALYLCGMNEKTREGFLARYRGR